MFNIKLYIKHKFKYSKLGRFIKYGYMFREYSDLDGMLFTIIADEGQASYDEQVKRHVTTRSFRRRMREAIEIADQLLKGTVGDQYADMADNKYPIEDIYFSREIRVKYKNIPLEDTERAKKADKYRRNMYNKSMGLEKEYNDRLFDILKSNLNRWWT